jgi:hypothetical protein
MPRHRRLPKELVSVASQRENSEEINHEPITPPTPATPSRWSATDTEIAMLFGEVSREQDLICFLPRFSRDSDGENNRRMSERKEEPDSDWQLSNQSVSVDFHCF